MIKDKICYFNKNADKVEIKKGIVYVNNSLVKELGQGVDGIVYKYKDKAIKLYHDDMHIKLHLTKNEIDRLCNLYTERIILPREVLINDNIASGFIMNYIDTTSQKDILLVDKKHLINEIKEVEDELILLGKNNFLLEDTKPENLFYNGNFYMFDPDSFIYEKNFDASKENLKVFAWYFFRYIIFLLKPDIYHPEYLSCIRKINNLYKQGNYLLLSDFLENNIEKKLIESKLIEPSPKKVKTLHNKYF